MNDQVICDEAIRKATRNLPAIGKDVKTPAGKGVLCGKILRMNGSYRLLVRFLAEDMPPGYAQPMKGCRWVVVAFMPEQVEVIDEASAAV